MFTDMIGEGTGDREFRWTVNRFGDVVIRKEGGTGSVVVPTQYELRTHLKLGNVYQPWDAVSGCRLWCEVVEILNTPKKKPFSRGHAQAFVRFARFARNKEPIEWSAGGYVVTKYGASYDAANKPRYRGTA